MPVKEYSAKKTAIKGGKQAVIGIITALILMLSKNWSPLESLVSALGGTESAAIIIFAGLNTLQNFIKHKIGINF